jgi:hypothetical protein
MIALHNTTPTQDFELLSEVVNDPTGTRRTFPRPYLDCGRHKSNMATTVKLDWRSQARFSGLIFPPSELSGLLLENAITVGRVQVGLRAHGGTQHEGVLDLLVLVDEDEMVGV